MAYTVLSSSGLPLSSAVPEWAVVSPLGGPRVAGFAEQREMNMGSHDLPDVWKIGFLLSRIGILLREEWASLLCLLVLVMLAGAFITLMVFCLQPFYQFLRLTLRCAVYPLKWACRRIYHWWTIRLEVAPATEDKVYYFKGDPYPDCRGGRQGLYANIELEDRTIAVMLHPQWWALLPGALSQPRQECAVNYSTESNVATGSEPASLVVLQTEAGVNLGAASRVQHGGSSVLLTASHVLRTGKAAGPVYIAKHNKNNKSLMRVLLDPEWPAVFGCGHADVDLAAIRVPDTAWSLLGVGTAKVVKPTLGKTACRVFGFKTGDKTWRSSTGTATAGEHNCSLVHTCTTYPGWSGSPLYMGNSIIGIHREAHKLGESNLATIAFPFFLRKEDSGDKTVPFKELEDQEMIPSLRPGMVSAQVWGMGEMKFTSTSFVRPGNTSALDLETRLKARSRPLWADMIDDLELPEFEGSVEVSPLNEVRGAQSNATPPSPIIATVAPIPLPVQAPLLSSENPEKIVGNPLEPSPASAPALEVTPPSTTTSPLAQTSEPLCASEPLLPPVTRVVIGSSEPSSSRTTSSSAADMSPRDACRFEKLADQLSALESAVLSLTQKQSELLDKYSQNSQSSVGPIEDQPPSSLASASKQENTSKRSRRRSSSKQRID